MRIHIFKNRKCSVIDFNDKEEIFFNYFCDIFKNKSKLNDILDTFNITVTNMQWVFSKWFLQNYENFGTYEELIIEYKKYTQAKIVKWNITWIIRDDNHRNKSQK